MNEERPATKMSWQCQYLSILNRHDAINHHQPQDSNRDNQKVQSRIDRMAMITIPSATILWSLWLPLSNITWSCSYIYDIEHINNIIILKKISINRTQNVAIWIIANNSNNCINIDIGRLLMMMLMRTLDADAFQHSIFIFSYSFLSQKRYRRHVTSSHHNTSIIQSINQTKTKPK